MARHAIVMVWRATGSLTVVWGLILVGQGLIPAAQALFLRNMVNRLVDSRAWTNIAPPASGVAALWILGQILSSAQSWVKAVQAERVRDEVHRLIHLQALRLDLSFYDHPESYDLLYRAQIDAIVQPLALLENLGLVAQNGLGFLVLAGILWMYARWLPILLICTAIPGLISVSRHTLRDHDWQQRNTVQERRARYLDWTITEQGSAAELRLFNIGSYHREAFEKVRRALSEGKLRLVRAGAIVELKAGLLSWSGSLFGLGWMLHQTLVGRNQLGDLLLCFQAFQQSQLLLRSLLEEAGKIYRSLLFVENVYQFLKIETVIGSEHHLEQIPSFKSSITFEGVSFTYPGGSRCALNDFDLDIPHGKVTALVGYNGAGKSTLIKLLCRFYDPSKGRILVDGVDLRKFDPEALRSQISVLFQEPVHYHASVADNIVFGDIGRGWDKARIRKAAEDAGALASIERLQGGFEAQLGKWFGGAELSTGEWQRIALARAFFRQAPLVILDEPTSAMDSWAELDWLSRFRMLTQGRTALMITHRFTTAMYADVIHVLDQGRVVEFGTHRELIANGGHYASSWSAQMREISHA